MRLLAVALCLLFTATSVDARPRRTQARHAAHKRDKSKQGAPRKPRISTHSEPRPKIEAPPPEPQPIDPYAELDAEIIEDGDGDDGERETGAQSHGSPWDGQLVNPTRFTFADGAYIRRPHRAYGTRSTVELTTRAIRETLALHPDAHVLAIGDISAERGGRISDHQSHQSGRDIDLGLFYKHKPAGYPHSFVDGTASNLDCAAMWTLIEKLAATAKEDGGVWAIFLDFEVQGVLYKWARAHGVAERKLDRIFQFPHGRGAAAGIVRHYRNHAHHLHARFKCTAAERADADCR